MKKKLEQFRLPVALTEALEAYSKASGMSKTDIVEMALREQMVRGVSSRVNAQLKAVEALNEDQVIYRAVAGSSAAIRLAQESGKKQTAESPSENKSSQASSGHGNRH